MPTNRGVLKKAGLITGGLLTFGFLLSASVCAFVAVSRSGDSEVPKLKDTIKRNEKEIEDLRGFILENYKGLNNLKGEVDVLKWNIGRDDYDLEDSEGVTDESGFEYLHEQPEILNLENDIKELKKKEAKYEDTIQTLMGDNQDIRGVVGALQKRVEDMEYQVDTNKDDILNGAKLSGKLETGLETLKVNLEDLKGKVL